MVEPGTGIKVVQDLVDDILWDLESYDHLGFRCIRLFGLSKFPNPLEGYDVNALQGTGCDC